jgi:hypothetical protein
MWVANVLTDVIVVFDVNDANDVIVVIELTEIFVAVVGQIVATDYDFDASVEAVGAVEAVEAVEAAEAAGAVLNYFL